MSPYAERAAHWQGVLGRLESRYNLLSAARAAVFVTALVLAWVALSTGAVALWWPFAAAAVFLGLIVAHERVAHSRNRARQALAWNERGLARLEDRWVGQGPDGDRFRDPAHPYADDLDLFGPGSVFQLLSTCRVPAGEERLAAWLLNPASGVVVRQRQAAVAEMRDRFDLREELAVLGAEVGSGLHRHALTAWAAGPAVHLPAWASGAALLAAAANVVAVVGALAWDWPGLVPLATIAAGALLATRVRARVQAVVKGVEAASRDLDHMADLVARLEREEWTSDLLRDVHTSLAGDQHPASRRIAQLHRLVSRLESRKNQLFMPVAALLLWTTQIACAVERWRARHGEAIIRWLDALAEVEALASLATFSADRPDYPFPEFSDGDALFDAEGLVHPLLPQAAAVDNAVRLGGEARALVVSGSNMSGKSTLLRAVGVNAVLAQSGAPVAAARLRLSRLAVGASFRPQDSLIEGRSRFYAEVTRLRQIVDLLGENRPVMFLLDELLSGTNSHDRAIGARAVVEHLVGRGAIGLLTTHDLALADIADALAPRALNVHFEDELVEGELRFDYRLRPGVVHRSNALELMRSVGLDV